MPNRRSKTAGAPLPARLPTLLPVLLSVLLLTACAGQPPSRTPVEPASQSPAAERAQTLSRDGRHAEAVILWRELARTSDGAQADHYRLRAAQSALAAGQMDTADELLQQVEAASLSGRDLAIYELSLARVRLAQDDPVAARRLLGNTAERFPRDLRQQWNTLDAAISRQNQRPENLALGRLQQSPDLDDDTLLYAILDLETLSMRRLRSLSQRQTADRQSRGWLELAIALRQGVFDEDRMARRLDDWRGRHRSHPLAAPAARGRLERLANNYLSSFSGPRQAALLLPLNGRLAAVGTALRDGFVAAAAGSGTAVNVYALDDSEQSARSAAFDAQDAGADQIVGPLSKTSVQAVATLPGLLIPVLALNEPSDRRALPLTQAFHSIALLPEDEAAAAAGRAYDLGMRRAIILAVEDEMGERLSAAFADAFRELGGEVLSVARFSAQQADHRDMLQGILRLEQSNQRRQSLQNELGVPLSGEPRARSDLDMIFLAARAPAARALRPQLKFFDADHIPVLATSLVYDGSPNRRRDRDMDGIVFSYPPWALGASGDGETGNALTLREADSLFGSLRGGPLAPFFALGMDAFRVLPYIDLLSRNPSLYFPGASASFRVNEDGRLVQVPAWARFRNGAAQLIAAPSATGHGGQR